MANAAGVSGLAGYASDRLAATAYAEERTYGGILTKDAISSAWKRREAEEHGEYVELGTFRTLEETKSFRLRCRARPNLRLPRFLPKPVSLTS